MPSENFSRSFNMHKGENMLKFYDIDEKYVDFLKAFDRQVPNIRYDSNNKFVCGTVLNINGVKYYAPISHNTTKQKTNIQIFDNGIPISTMRFSFMIPALDFVLKEKKFSEIEKYDRNYANLLRAEYKFCKDNKKDIYDKAMAVYKIGCNKNHKYNYTCCDFKLLEEHYKEYNQNKDATN